MKKQQDDMPENKVTPGYAPRGESLWSIHASKGHAVDTRRTPAKDYRTKLDVLIQHERHVVERLERRAKEAKENPDPRFPVGRSPTFLGICSRLQKTRILLARLEAELRRVAT